VGATRATRTGPAAPALTGAHAAMQGEQRFCTHWCLCGDGRWRGETSCWGWALEHACRVCMRCGDLCSSAPRAQAPDLHAQTPCWPAGYHASAHVQSAHRARAARCSAAKRATHPGEHGDSHLQASQLDAPYASTGSRTHNNNIAARTARGIAILQHAQSYISSRKG
jgi:hypothetical protein